MSLPPLDLATAAFRGRTRSAAEFDPPSRDQSAAIDDLHDIRRRREALLRDLRTAVHRAELLGLTREVIAEAAGLSPRILRREVRTAATS